MRAADLPRFLQTAVAATVLAAAIVALPAEASSPPVVTVKGIGGLQLGRSLAQIQRLHLVGSPRKACDLGTRPQYNAPLHAPLRGYATFDGNVPTSPMIALSITGGAVTDRGIAIGASAAAVLRAYPGAKVEDSPPPNALVFSAIAVRKGNKDLIWFFLNRHGGHVESFELPLPQFCD